MMEIFAGVVAACFELAYYLNVNMSAHHHGTAHLIAGFAIGLGVYLALLFMREITRNGT